MKLKSHFELLLKEQYQKLNIIFIPEYRFHKVRKWRFDYACPELMIAIELEGGVFIGGRHTRGMGYVNDCEKYNEALKLGWRVLRYPTNKLASGFKDDIKQLMQ